MAYNGSGVYSLPGAALVDGQDILATEHNTLRNDMATAFNQCYLRNGTSTATANLPMGGFKLTGLGDATVAGDALNFNGNAGTPSAIVLTNATGTAAALNIGGNAATATNATNATQLGGVAAAGYAKSGANTDITSLSAHPVGRAIAQIVTSATGTVATGTTLIPNDNTIPQNTEGDQYLSQAITPQSATSTLVIEAQIVCASSVANACIAALFQDTTANALTACAQYQASAGGFVLLRLRHVMTSGTVAATTFKVRAGQAAAGTLTFNGSGGTQYYGGVMNSYLTITEVLP